MTIKNLRIIFTYIQNAVRLEMENSEIPKTCITKIISNIFLKEYIIVEILELNIKKQVQYYSLFICLKYFGIYCIPIMINIQCISSSNHFIYINFCKIPIILGGFGIIFISGSMGLMTN